MANNNEDESYLEDSQDKGCQPWYRLPEVDHPFQFVRKINLHKPNPPAFRGMSFFPWEGNSLEHLWQGSVNTADNQARWKSLVADYWDAVAVTSDHCLYIFFTLQKKLPIVYELTHAEGGQKLLDNDKMCVSWAMNHRNPCEPLVLFSKGSVLYVYNLERRGVEGYIRGHGGAITSIAVHPTNVSLCCTTSRDFSTRVYDLNLDAAISNSGSSRSQDEKVSNPPWPPNTKPSLAGAAHGLRLPVSGREGSGTGRCICVLMGGRSGGHNAAVLSAAFHPFFPLIATCGLDRAVKIWPVRPTSEIEIKRVDKPLFSSSKIHKARVMSISWLEDDLLLTHSAPAVMRKDPDSSRNRKTYIEAGEMIIWQWLGLNRFFPANQEITTTTFRGVSRDYLDSDSFNIISTHSFPDVPSQLISPSLSLYQNSINDPLALLTYSGNTSIHLVNLALMQPQPTPLFPKEVTDRLLGGPPPSSFAADTDAALPRESEDQPHAPESGINRGRLVSQHTVAQRSPEHEEDEGVSASEAIWRSSRLTGTTEALNHDDLDEDEGVPPSDSEDEGSEVVLRLISKRRPLAPPPPPIPVWSIKVPPNNDGSVDGRRLMESAMGLSGNVISAVGERGTLWIWRRSSDRS